MTDLAPFTSRSFRMALRLSGLGVLIGLALLFLDVLAGIQLPQPFRAGIPWLLLVSLGVGITLLVGSLGMPKREATTPESPTSE